VKTFSRSQLRDVLEAWMREPEKHEEQSDSLYYRGVAAYLDYLDTFQFNGNGGGKMDRATGKVKWYNVKKAFGFIIPDDGGPDVFVHQTDLKCEVLKEGQKVEFDVEKTPKGLQAIDVVVIL
jgi:cold shock protein